jgi:crotonobetainyl-CoA:carnitine CoA-transferase CaiB-like acyl-CoA transferase
MANPEPGPMRAAVPITDIFTGLYAAIGVLAAVIHHRQTGEGQYIDAAMIDVTTAINGHLALGYLMTGTVPKREGNNNPITAPSEVFRGADGYFSMSAGNNGQFANLLATLGIGAATAQDPRFVNNIERIRHRKELHEILEAQTVQQPVMHWIDTLSAANVPCAPIYDMQQLLADPHVQGRELVLQPTACQWRRCAGVAQSFAIVSVASEAQSATHAGTAHRRSPVPQSRQVGGGDCGAAGAGGGVVNKCRACGTEPRSWQ